MKYIILLLALVVAPISTAAIVTTSEGKITRIHTYDDYKGGTVFIYLSHPISACPAGAYLNPTSPGIERLYSIALASMMANKKVTFQLYDDRIIDTRCEIDAIQVGPE
jgi:hypothetical protein